MPRSGLYGENPDPEEERHQKFLAEQAYQNSRSARRGTEITRILGRWEEEELAKTYTAELFLNEVNKCCRDRGISLEDIPLAEKVEFLKVYRGFTGIDNSFYPEGASDKIVHRTFTDKCLEARSLFREA